MFKFTIRDLLWLTVVVALGVGWWIDHRWPSKLREENEEMRKQLSSLTALLDKAGVKVKVEKGHVEIYATGARGGGFHSW
jgi:hypothetical protein